VAARGSDVVVGSKKGGTKMVNLRAYSLGFLRKNGTGVGKNGVVVGETGIGHG
jgi:hypothetical protein